MSIPITSFTEISKSFINLKSQIIKIKLLNEIQKQKIK